MSKSKSGRGRAYLRHQRFRVRNRIKKLLQLQRPKGYTDEDQVPILERSRPRQSVRDDDPWHD